MNDRLAWVRTKEGQYSVKIGYQLWHNLNVGASNVIQNEGRKRIWRLDVPHKIKVFLWRFFRNNLPVRKRLRSKGVILPITSPMCTQDIEHQLHVFFDCQFASQCWRCIGVTYDMQVVTFAPEWLLNKLKMTSSDEMMRIDVVLWGIWFWRNKRVWENIQVTPALAVDWSSKMLAEWKKANALRVSKGTTGATCMGTVLQH